MVVSKILDRNFYKILNLKFHENIPTSHKQLGGAVAFLTVKLGQSFTQSSKSVKGSTPSGVLLSKYLDKQIFGQDFKGRQPLK